MCTFDTNKIYLTWRKDLDKPRHIVGVLQKNDTSYSFEYLKSNVKNAINTDGFTYYPAFQDTNCLYENALDIFKRRLLPPSRSDYDDFLNYWNAGKFRDDTFALLGLTGAKLLTDNFEFIAPHEEIPAKFYTEVSWINKKSDYIVNSIKSLSLEEIAENLSLKVEPDNKFDDKAVKVLFKEENLGYIKSIHCQNITNAILNRYSVRIKVPNVIKNGTIKEIMLEISIG